MATAASSWIPASDGLNAATAWALLDLRCYIADSPNATTAKGFTSRGLPIQVTFYAARPPVLSHFCVHCPDANFPGAAPKVINTHAGLVLLRVPINPDALLASSKLCWDYFVYTPHRPALDLLPNPYPTRFNDSEAAIVKTGNGGDYVIATLRNRMFARHEFDLNLYRSTNAEEGWVSKRLSVHDPVRDTLVPFPHAVSDLYMYHETGKTVSVGGERSTVAWVDLWRGIIFCDVLDECPVLRDIPLPPPAMGNWGRLLQECQPNFVRDVTVSRGGGSIKYLEMEIRPPSEQAPAESYLEWARKKPSRFSVPRRDGWKATTWIMPTIPVGASSSEGWHKECEVYVDEVDVAETWLSKLSLCGGGGTEAATLKGLAMSYPTMSMDDDVVYFLSKVEELEMVVAVDARKKMLCGVAQLDSQKNFMWMPTYCSSDITSHLNKTRQH